MEQDTPQISPICTGLDQRDRHTYAIIGAAMAVHAELGSGFLEAVYQAALAVELSVRRIPFTTEQPLEIRYRNQILPVNYRADFVCYDSIIVELKALSKLSGTEKAQVINYIKATSFPKALLINFGEPSLKFERIVL